MVCIDHHVIKLCECGANTICPNCHQGSGSVPCHCTPNTTGVLVVDRESARVRQMMAQELDDNTLLAECERRGWVVYEDRPRIAALREGEQGREVPQIGAVYQNPQTKEKRVVHGPKTVVNGWVKVADEPHGVVHDG